MHACTRCGDIPAVMRKYFATGIDRHCARALCHRRHAHPDPGRLSRPQTRQISRHDSARQSAGDAMPVVSRWLRQLLLPLSRTITQSLPLPLPTYPRGTCPFLSLICMSFSFGLQGLAKAPSSRIAINDVPRNHRVHQGRYVTRADDMKTAHAHAHCHDGL
jgi:hypothetical protein